MANERITIDYDKYLKLKEKAKFSYEVKRFIVENSVLKNRLKISNLGAKDILFDKTTELWGMIKNEQPEAIGDIVIALYRLNKYKEEN